MQLGPTGSLRPLVYSTLFSLLWATGLRISEALGLTFEDVTPDGLLIRKTKFGKSRLVPLHQTAAAGLDRYLAQRKKTAAGECHLFVSVLEGFQPLFRRLFWQPGAGAGDGGC